MRRQVKSKFQNPNSKIRVLVVDDSLTVRKKITDILRKAPDIAIAGEARDGKEAIEQAKKLKPAAILMDLVMPVMSGLAAIEYIMSHHPVPIVVHSSAENRGETYKTLDALMAGALVEIEKTEAQKNPEKWEKDLIRTLRAASRIKVSRRRKPYLRRQKGEAVTAVRQLDTGGYNIVAIGASTGGPGIIAHILKAFPSDFRLPVLLVIHIANSSNNTFADWLNENCSLNVAFASNGEPLNQVEGRVFIAPPDKHMVVGRNRIRLVDSPPVNHCRPSVDVLFHSLAQSNYMKPIATLLTGMGRDGALGLKAINNNGGYTICQDKKTSVVFGMPKAAIDMGAADVVLPNYHIAETIMELTNMQ